MDWEFYWLWASKSGNVWRKKKVACGCVISVLKHMIKTSNSIILRDAEKLLAKIDVVPKVMWVGKSKVRVYS